MYYHLCTKKHKVKKHKVNQKRIRLAAWQGMERHGVKSWKREIVMGEAQYNLIWV